MPAFAKGFRSSVREAATNAICDIVTGSQKDSRKDSQGSVATRRLSRQGLHRSFVNAGHAKNAPRVLAPLAFARVVIGSLRMQRLRA